MRSSLVLSIFFASCTTTLGQVTIQGGGELYDGQGTHEVDLDRWPDATYPLGLAIGLHIRPQQGGIELHMHGYRA